MEQTNTTASKRKERTSELVRPLQGRMLAGVARGLADNFGISEWIPRLFFVVTAFMGGLGIALYVAGWVFIRSEDETESAAERFFTDASGTWAWIGIGLILLAGVTVLDNFTFLAGEVVWAGVLLAVGLLLYLGYIPVGRNRDGESPSEPAEGAQRMSATETLESTTAVVTDTGESSAGGSSPPPPEPAPTPPDLPPTRPRERSVLGRLTIGVMLLGLGMLATLDNIDALLIEANPRHYMALAVTILGVGLLVGSIVGRARWLIIVGLIMVPTLLFSPVFEYDWSEEQFDRRVAPATFEELAPSYSLEVGSLVIDLRDLEWASQTVDLTASVEVGNLEIWVPPGVAIEGEARADIGRVSGPNDESFGFGDPLVSFDTEGDLGLLVILAEVDAGNIEVVYR
ncbi:MAG: PspC domain-containing protein [Acidimicrobiia bacterium]